MKLSASLSLITLLSSSSLSVVAHRGSRHADTAARKRMLARNERRALQGTTGGARGNLGQSFESATDYGNNAETNINGIVLAAKEDLTYAYGAPITVNFEIIENAIDTEVLSSLDAANMGEWTMGLYMRMANPQGGNLPPIMRVLPSIQGGSRRLQGIAVDPVEDTTQDFVNADMGGDGDNTGSMYQNDMDMGINAVVTRPSFPVRGSATFTRTDANALNHIKYGTGFDVFLLDENGFAIVGPATFYMLPDEDGIQGQGGVGVTTVGKASAANHPLVKYDHAMKKKKNAKKDEGTTGSGVGSFNTNSGGDPAMGYGSGINGGMILGTAESLGTYLLRTERATYNLGDDVTVNYNISPTLTAEGRDRMLRETAKGDVFSPSVGFGLESALSHNSQDELSENSEDEPSFGSEDESSLDSEGEFPSTGTRGTGAPDRMTTTTTIPVTVDMGAGSDGGDLVGVNSAIAAADPAVDPADVTLFKLGVFMRMANPQGGSLAPILSVPLCGLRLPCTKTAGEIEQGSVSFSTLNLNVAENGSGFDVWILNGVGAGVAGPFTFLMNL